MTKPIYFIGTCALVTAAAILVWSQNPAVFHANTASVAVETPSLPAASPAGKPLPVEQWDAF